MIAFWSWMILFGHDLRILNSRKLDKPSLTPPTLKNGHFSQKFSRIFQGKKCQIRMLFRNSSWRTKKLKNDFERLEWKPCFQRTILRREKIAFWLKKFHNSKIQFINFFQIQKAQTLSLRSILNFRGSIIKPNSTNYTS